MKVYIQVDFEGIAGMIEWDDYITDTHSAHEKRSRLRHILTDEVNAAVLGAQDAGADEILVWDSHGPSNNCNNIYFEDLDPCADIIIGWKGIPSFYPLLDDSFDAGLYIGGHAMAGSEHAVLPHTKTVLNSIDYGEVGMFAAMCGWFDVPMVFVSGDRTTVEEVQNCVPDVEYVITKESFSPYAARIMAPKRVQKQIREGAEKALQKTDSIKPVQIGPPFTITTSKKEITGDDLFELFNLYVDPDGEIFGNQDVQPERDRIQNKRKKWKENDSFLAP
ncbi:M55 family metallopeptidase [Planctomycetota bacterium]